MIQNILFLLLVLSFLYSPKNNGALAQLARALAWHARGHRFDSDMLHKSHSWWDLFLMFNVYILYSVTLDRFYVGQTDDLDKRLVSHLSGISRYTAIAKDWQLVYKEQFNSRTEAIHRENEIKRKKSRKYIEWLINNKSI